jgi:hypothetical protein
VNDLIISREAAAHRGRRLEYFTIVWNSLEGLTGVGAGTIAGSISLVGFGIDSLIEVTSGATLLWRMSVDADAARRERNERLSLRVVGACFLALALYVAIEAVLDLGRKAAPERSVPGVPWGSALFPFSANIRANTLDPSGTLLSPSQEAGGGPGGGGGHMVRLILRPGDDTGHIASQLPGIGRLIRIEKSKPVF